MPGALEEKGSIEEVCVQLYYLRQRLASIQMNS
jgi:hypothetical protein